MRSRKYLFAPLILALISFGAIRNAHAVDYAKIPIKLVPRCLPSDQRALLLARRDQLMTRLKDYNDQADTFLQKCRAVRSDETSLIQHCSGEQSRLQALQGDIAKTAADFKIEVEQKAFEFAGEVVAAMEDASKELQALPPKDIGGEPKGRQPKGRPTDARPAVTDNCRDFFDRVIRNLGRRRGKAGEEWENPSHGMNADQVATALIKNRTKPASGGRWTRLPRRSSLLAKERSSWQPCPRVLIGLTDIWRSCSLFHRPSTRRSSTLHIKKGVALLCVMGTNMISPRRGLALRCLAGVP
jgi:hypothetical protein